LTVAACALFETGLVVAVDGPAAGPLAAAAGAVAGSAVWAAAGEAACASRPIRIAPSAVAVTAAPILDRVPRKLICGPSLPETLCCSAPATIGIASQHDANKSNRCTRWCLPRTGEAGAREKESNAMAVLTIELGEGDLRDLDAAAAAGGVTRAALAQRWIEERLLHERERAAGGGRSASPRTPPIQST